MRQACAVGPIRSSFKSFQIDLSYTCGRAKTMRERYMGTRFFFENGEKKLRFNVWTGVLDRSLVVFNNVCNPRLQIFYICVNIWRSNS